MINGGIKMYNKILIVLIFVLLFSFSCYTKLYLPNIEDRDPDEQRREAYEEWQRQNRYYHYHYRPGYSWHHYHYRPYWYDWDWFWRDSYHDRYYHGTPRRETRIPPEDRTTPSTRTPSDRSSSDDRSRTESSVSTPDERPSPTPPSRSESTSDGEDKPESDDKPTEIREGSRAIPEGR